jgi:protein arginine kinase activator
MGNMLCQNCQKSIANVHFTQVINGSKIELYLCENCAKEKGQINFSSPFNISDFFSGFIGSGQRNPYVASAPQHASCEKCGMSYEEFLKRGKLGCSNCYELYSDKLGSILKRLHGNAEHHGKLPGRVAEEMKASSEIKKLKELLNKAIQDEEYEEAAKIRDQIKGLEV